MPQAKKHRTIPRMDVLLSPRDTDCRAAIRLHSRLQRRPKPNHLSPSRGHICKYCSHCDSGDAWDVVDEPCIGRSTMRAGSTVSASRSHNDDMNMALDLARARGRL